MKNSFTDNINLSNIVVKNSIIKGSDSDFFKKVTRWQRIVKEASEQSKRTRVPLIDKVIDYKNFRFPEQIELRKTIHDCLDETTIKGRQLAEEKKEAEKKAQQSRQAG